MPPTLAIFTGSATSFNTRLDTLNIGWILKDTFDLHLITTRKEIFSKDTLDYFEVYDSKQPPNFLGGVRALNYYMQGNNPKVVTHLINPPIHGTVVGLISKKYGIPFIYRYSGDRFFGYKVAKLRKKPFFYMVNNVLGILPLNLADRYIVMGPNGKKRLVEKGCDPDEIAILPPPIDKSRFDHESCTKTTFNIPEDRKIVLIVGRLTRLKGIDFLEKAIPKILSKRKDLQFVFIGGGARYPKVPKEYKGHITIIGPVEPTEIIKFFQSGDVLLHPSLNESFGRVLVEAQFCGIPVIARDVGDVSSITHNTFSSEEEMLDKLYNFEKLPVNDVSSFSRQSLSSEYVSFFSRYCGD